MSRKSRSFKGAFADKLHQPYRADLIPGMYDVFAAANSKGALGTTISGAGPTLIAYTIEMVKKSVKQWLRLLQNIILALNT